MRRYRWFCLLLITTLLLASCQAITESNPGADGQALPQVKVNPLTFSVSALQMGIKDLEVNECLNCHADKQRLIDTAKVEEIVEAESSGVG